MMKKKEKPPVLKQKLRLKVAVVAEAVVLVDQVVVPVADKDVVQPVAQVVTVVRVVDEDK